ncbi:glycosyltransferase family 2 protein [Sulfuriroseicoccus oceanibius]|uniref:Glycosyltransferase family 2 protein n=1 Tax=Sulfuriroseicoccus oceanibius TaxID=2707525 RepID=A0A6B3L5V7_9BACT|nr:glycosyltransferase family 2 protein [Sulfuriroseicoccus oceanibius]QQL45469.1 glycosyltransferase family 2 protein [Sulfuriroseicoccus oceanibius]
MVREGATPTDTTYDIAVIIPVYNVERYLENCLDSILSQTIADRIQLIVINDGSTDGSGAIADEFARRHSNIIYKEKENEGQGVARNLGMSLTSAPYVIFLDSDDRMPPDACEALLREIINTKADLVLGRPMWKRDDGSEDPFGYLDHWYAGENCGRNVRRKPELALTHPIPVAKIYSLAFLKANQLLFPPITGEDAAFAMAVVDRARDIRIIDHIVYWRTERDDPANLSVMQTFTLKTAKDRIRLIQLFLECYDKSSLPADVLKLIYSKVRLILSMIDKIADKDDQKTAFQLLGDCLAKWAKPNEREMLVDPLLRESGHPGGLHGLAIAPNSNEPENADLTSLNQVSVIVLCNPKSHTTDDLAHTLHQIADQSRRPVDVTIVGADSSLATRPLPKGLPTKMVTTASPEELPTLINQTAQGAMGDWIRIVHCGDPLPELQFEEMVSAAHKNGCSAVYAMPPEYKKQKQAPLGNLSREIFLQSPCGISCAKTLMVTRDAFLAMGGIDNTFVEFGIEKFLIDFFHKYRACGILDPSLPAPTPPAAKIALSAIEDELAMLTNTWRTPLMDYPERFRAAVDLTWLCRATHIALTQGDSHYLTRVIQLLEQETPSLLVPYIGWLKSTHPEVYNSLPSAWVPIIPERKKSKKLSKPSTQDEPKAATESTPRERPNWLSRLFGK